MVRSSNYRRRPERGTGAHQRRLRKAVTKRDGWRCVACGKGTNTGEVDHITPLRKGGSDDLSNLQYLCKPCHAAKTAKEWGREDTPERAKWRAYAAELEARFRRRQ